MENKFKIKPKSKSKHFAGGIFSGIEKRLKLENYFEEGFPVKYLPKILFVMVLGLIYISNTHYAEKTVRKINNIQVEVEDLRADYTTLKSDLMFRSEERRVGKECRS